MIDIAKAIRDARFKAAREREELFGSPSPSPLRRKPRHEESEIQQACIRWFRYAYPRYVIFSVPNGGSRNVVEAANLKKEGALAGVSDLIIVAERRVLFVEMKRPKGRQQQSQKDFQHRVEVLGHRYVVCYSLDDFRQKVSGWLGERRVSDGT